MGDQGIVDVCLLVDTYPWWKRALSWIVWKNRPFKWVARMFWRSPYCRVVALVNPATAVRGAVREMRGAVTNELRGGGAKDA